MINDIMFKARRLILRKIPQNLTIAIRYEDDEFYRTIDPHIAYESTTDDILIGAYQQSNPDADDKQSGWRDFDIKKIRDVIFTDDVFEPESTFNPASDRYTRTLCRIA
jgi:hypothetical protein